MHASSVNEVWQADTADMRTFGEAKIPIPTCWWPWTSFPGKNFAEPMRGTSAEEAVKAFKQFEPYGPAGEKNPA